MCGGEEGEGTQYAQLKPQIILMFYVLYIKGTCPLAPQIIIIKINETLDMMLVIKEGSYGYFIFPVNA